MMDIYNVASGLMISEQKYKEIFEEKVFHIRTEDGNYIRFAIKKNNLPHLLGVKSNVYNLDRDLYNNNIYNFFQRIMTCTSVFDKCIKNGELEINELFSSSISVKLNAFNNLKENEFNIPFVISCDDKTKNPELDYLNCEHFIYFSNDLESFKGYLLGLKFDMENRHYIPVTLLACENEEYFNRIIRESNISLIKRLEINNLNNNESKTIQISKEDRIRIKKLINKVIFNQDVNYIKVSSKELNGKRKVSQNKKEEIIQLKEQVAFLNKALREVLADNQEYEKAYMELYSEFQNFKNSLNINRTNSNYTRTLKY